MVFMINSGKRLRVGFDLVQISKIQASVDSFGKQFQDKLFTEAEVSYCYSGVDLWGERLAARFAAKEATIKALQLANAGVSWRDIEVCKLPSGDCELVLHGHVAELASQLGVEHMALSMSHDGDYAGATVVVMCSLVQ